MTIFQNFHAIGNIFKTANSHPTTGRNYSGHILGHILLLRNILDMLECVADQTTG